MTARKMNDSNYHTDASLVQRKKRLSGCAVAIIACVVLVLLTVCLYWVWTIRCEREFARQLKEIEARGEPVTVEQVDAFYVLKEGTTDATELWSTATAQFEEQAYADDARPFPIVGMEEYEIPTVGQPWPQLDDAEAFLQRYHEPLDTMHSAAETKGKVRFPRDFADGFLVAFNEVQRLRQGARILRLNTRVQAHRGKPDEVLKSLHTMVRLGESIEREPILVSQLVRTVMLTIAAHATGQALGDVEFSDSQLAELQNAFGNIDMNEGFRRALAGERFMVIQELKTGFEDTTGIPPHVLQFIPQDTGTFFDMMERCIDAVDKPFVESMAEVETLEEDMNALRGPRQIVSKLTLPAMRSLTAGRTRSEAYLKMVVAAAGVKRFQLAEGRLPKDLAEVAPKYFDTVPLDPFDQQPIRYIPGDDGVAFTVYCIGKDGADDGAAGENDELDHALKVGQVVEWVEQEDEEE